MGNRWKQSGIRGRQSEGRASDLKQRRVKCQNKTGSRETT